MHEIMKERVVKQYILLLTLYSMSHMVTAGIYVTFLQSKGMSLLQVNLINAVYFAFMFLFEIPTGAFADIFGRKRSFVIACVLCAISEVVYGMSHTFWGFLTAEIIAAAGYTFMSGAFKAWLVDSLKHKGYAEVESRVYARAQSTSRFVGVWSAILGSYMGTYSLAIPWFIGGALAFVAAIVGQRTMKEAYFIHKEFSVKSGLQCMKETIRSSIHYGMTDKTVRFILIIAFIQILAVQPLNMYWQPFYGSLGIKPVYYGCIYFFIIGGLALGAKITEWINTKDEKKLIIRTQLIAGVLVILAVISPHWIISVSLFVLHEVARGFWEPLKDSYLHKRIPSHERATIDSFCSVSPHIGGAMGLVVSGAIAEYGGIPLSWFVGGLVLVIGALLVARNGDKHST